MKILVISLLRLGDFVQILPVLNGLKTQFNVKKLDVLTFSSVRQLQPMAEDVDRWWTLDREELQKGLRYADLPMLTSFSVLQEKLDSINAQKYDCVINLTQTHFSGWVAGYLEAPQRVGLIIDNKGTALFHSPWFQYLDDSAVHQAKDVFNYTDIFFHGSGLKGGERVWNLAETKRGQEELALLGITAPENIALQVLTSDSKKTWPSSSWLGFMRQMQLFRPDAEFTLLGAPNEDAQIEELLQNAIRAGVRAQKAIVSLEGALSVLKKSSLLVSGDTSIKHLANATGTPVLELSLGSSDWRRTGTYKNDSLILQAGVACAPCPHSSPCSKASHLCAEQLSASAVSLAAHHLLAGDWQGLKQIAEEYQGEVQFLRTRITGAGFMIATDISESQPEKTIEMLVERYAQKFVLNRDHLEPLAQFGSAGVQIRHEIEEIYPARGPAAWASHLEFMESQATSLSNRAETLLQTVQKRQPQIDEIKDFIEGVQPHSSALPWLEKLREQSRQGVVEIAPLRRVHNQLERLAQQSLVKMKLIRSLKSQLTESK